MSRCRVYDTECLNDRFCQQHGACCAGDMECQPMPPVTTDDTLDDVLDVAAEILREYGDPGNTRVERLARWVVTNLGGEPYTPLQASDLLVEHCLPGFFDVDQNRAAAVAYIRFNEGGDE